MLLDRDPQLYEGPQYFGDKNRPNFGLFLDSRPDCWGRLFDETVAESLQANTGVR